MSSKPTEPHSIASQLVLLFSIAAALLLFCGLGVLYLIVVRHAFEEDNEVLSDKVLSVRADIDRAGVPVGLNEELQVLRRGEHVPYLVRVLDSTGTAVAETPGMAEALPRAAFPDPEAMAADHRAGRDFRSGGKLFSCVAVSHEVAGQRYTIQVAQDRSSDERFMRHFALLVAVMLAIGLLAAAAIAARVTRRGLRPLVRMTESLRRIGPNQLHERLTATGWPRELQPLAGGFDQMLDRLEDSFTRLSQFSADLAHELRTPVANIRGEAEVALTRLRTPEEYREVIESTVAECQQLSGIIDNLLFLARAEGTERQIKCVPFDARSEAEKIAEYYRTLAEERHITISCSGQGQIEGDLLLFGRALSNLIENALRFTPDGGRIETAITARQRTVDVSVRDNGCGIPAEHLPNVFDRFYRVDASRSSEGTGLGLALVKSITELHGGKAQITSTPGAGTTVTLTFPLAPDSARAAKAHSRGCSP